MPGTEPDVTVAAGPGMSTHHGGAGTPPFPATPPSVVSNPPPGAPVKSVGGMTGTFGQGAMGGQPFGPRYHLVRLLGAGGMGAVYQAWDQELGVVVAIKVIKPEAMENPEAARELERRFKRELLLARNVTHKNVVRIHDLGEVEGVKYITMPYVHGSDLGSIIKREHKVPLTRALNIAKQIAAGLVAAHDAGVVHRDLKPANILLDENEHALITDFGIARSTSGTAGGTVLGTVVGTLDYMAPEQARGQAVDHRADIYAFGLIMSDMLIGRRQTGHGGESSLAALMNRMTTIMPPIRSVDPNIPQTVSDIVSRCTALDAEHRYAKTKDLLKDLESLDDHGHPMDGSVPAATHAWTQPLPAQTVPGQMYPGQTMPGQMYPGQTMPGQTMPGQTVQVPGIPTAAGRPSTRLWLMLVAGILISALGTGAFLFRHQLFGGGGDATQVAIAILPFRNATQDPTLDNLGPTIGAQLRTEFGETEAVRAVDSGQVAQILRDLRISPEANLDPATAKRIGGQTTATVVVSGHFQTFGQQIQITANLQDLKSNQSTPVTVSAESRNQLLTAIRQLAAALREKLVLAPEAVKALEASAYRPSSKSIEALRFYNEGLARLREGKLLEAQKAFEASTQQDGEFALAYAKLAQTYAALGFAPEAEKQARKAESLLAGVQGDAEKFLIQAITARISKNRAAAVGFLEKLAAMRPGSDEVLSDLASAYEDNGSYVKAHETYTKLISRDPKNFDALLGLGRIEVRRGQPKDAIKPLTEALIVANERQNDEAKATAKEWLGVSYRWLNNLDEAMTNYKEALEIARRLGRRRLEAEITHEMGKVQHMLGQPDQALKSYQEALKIREALKDREGIGDTLIDFGNLYGSRGQYDQALTAFRESLAIQREQGNDDYVGLLSSNIGAVQFLKGENQDALTWYQQALTVREKYNNPGAIADTVYNIGEAYVRLGEYRKAEDQYLRALKLRRDGSDLRGESQVGSSLGTLFGYEGRLDAALSATKEAYDAIVASKERNDWTIIAFAAYGNALSSVGRVDEGRKRLDEAAKLARDLQIDPLLAMVFNYQGDQLSYAGDFGGARKLYEEALQVATRANDPYFTAWSKVNRTMAGLKGAGTRPTPGEVAKVVLEGDKYGVRYQAVACLIASGESLVVAKQYPAGKRELENALAAAEKSGMLLLQAQAHYWLSRALTGAGDEAGARGHLQDAQSLLQKVKTEAKSDAFLKRADVAPIAAAK